MKTRVSRSEVYSCCHSLSLEFSLCRWACLEVNQAAADLLISQPGVFKQLRDSYTSLDDYSTWIKPPPSSPTGYSLELQPACLSASPWPEPPPAAHLSSLDLSKLSSLHVSPSGSQSQESPLSPDRTTPPSSYFPPSTDSSQNGVHSCSVSGDPGTLMKIHLPESPRASRPPQKTKM
ncbi:uncharacterized protein [Nothobranchius furzeri]|uniref:uncharacterized protein isoform X2 n=1 Tax=Nothobranchius furzeri TaxID=105023 RepID=UPI003904773F